MDQLLVNLKPWELGMRPQLTRRLREAGERALMSGPRDYPVFGSDAFRTRLGSAAIIKAQRLGYADLADLIYSGVPAHSFGLSQEIEIGRMSGKSNVMFWLEQRGLSVEPALVDRILGVAHQSATVLTERELLGLVESHS